MALTFAVQSTLAGELTIGVIYPETSPAFRKVFDDIRHGIERSLQGVAVETLRLDSSAGGDLDAWVRTHALAAVITLGARASADYRAGNFGAPQVVGAVNATPQNNSNDRGIGLSPSPSSVFDVLSAVAPKVRRIWVVFNPQRDQWLMTMAAAAAGKRSLQLMPLDARDLRAAAKRFVEVFETARPQRDALWLLEDSALVNSESTMPFLVEKSWQREVPIISNTLLHARLGAAIAVYPDPVPLGEALGTVALAAARGEPGTGVQPLMSLRKAMNSRFARHLRLRVRAEQFDLVFPQR